MTTGKALEQIWNDVLQRSGEISDQDGFFALGGDSVSMMMMIFRIEKTLKVEVAPEQVYENDGFAAMVARIEELRRV